MEDSSVVPPYTIRILNSLIGVSGVQWNSLVGTHPLLRYEFLHALHETGCAVASKGWQAHYPSLWIGDTLQAVAPLYIKQHSFGEFVFDWAWARAWQGQGMSYYPKAILAIPFTPCTTPRFWVADLQQRDILWQVATREVERLGLSSLHVLFPTSDERDWLGKKHLPARTSVQFHWYNQGYHSFDQFLSTLSADKRKKIRQERARLSNKGIRFIHRRGADITEKDWTFWFNCYQNTYHAHGSHPYLNRAFFEHIGHSMPENILLIIAEQGEGHPIAASFSLYNQHTLYGRYWGCLESVPGLHFATCYYEPLEFCIEQGIQVFEGGAQGEHKLARGFIPTECFSSHWFSDPQMSTAIAHWTKQETLTIDRYVDELQEHLPYRKED